MSATDASDLASGGGIRVGLLDSGLDAALAAAAVAQRRFRLDADGQVHPEPAEPDAIGHGSALARILLELEPRVRLVNAQIFTATQATSAAAAAAGLRWLVAEGVPLANLSFGLREDRAVLREACAEAAAAGMVLLAASPARGAPVFPAAYPGVIRITGDARCGRREVSWLDTVQSDVGAHVRPLDPLPVTGPPPGGASFAVPHATALLASHILNGGACSEAAARAFFQGIARYRGPERRAAPDPSAAEV